jgi:hypothetical protein
VGKHVGRPHGDVRAKAGLVWLVEVHYMLPFSCGASEACRLLTQPGSPYQEQSGLYSKYVRAKNDPRVQEFISRCQEAGVWPPGNSRHRKWAQLKVQDGRVILD